MPLDDLSRSASQEFTVGGGEYEKKGMKNYAAGNDLRPRSSNSLDSKGFGFMSVVCVCFPLATYFALILSQFRGLGNALFCLSLVDDSVFVVAIHVLIFFVQMVGILRSPCPQ
jgi:hypothetical protein